jgi:hypothetical protein
MTADKIEATDATAPKARKTIAAETAPGPASTARAAVADGLKKAGKAFAETKAFSKDNLDALTASASAATNGVREVSALGVGFAKSRIETNLAAAQSLNGAKAIGDVLDIQHAFFKGAIEAYSTEYGNLSQTLRAAFKGAFRPLSERAGVLYAKVAPAR